MAGFEKIVTKVYQKIINIAKECEIQVIK